MTTSHQLPKIQAPITNPEPCQEPRLLPFWNSIFLRFYPYKAYIFVCWLTLRFASPCVWLRAGYPLRGVLILYFFFSWERISITSHTIFRAALALLCFSMFSGWKSEKRLAWGRATASPRGSDTLQLPPCRGKSVKCIFYSGESLLLFCISQYQLGFHKQII